MPLKGWSLKDPTAGDFPFSLAEPAVAAATFLEQIPPGVPEDPLYALFVMLGFWPPECDKLFSTVPLTCSHCLATVTAPCPFFNTHVTWAMAEWVNLATSCLADASTAIAIVSHRFLLFHRTIGITGHV